MRKIIALLLFFFPSAIALPLAHILRKEKFTYKKGAKVGFSIIICEEIHLGPSSRIGHMNLIKTHTLSLSDRARIKQFNILKGRFEAILHINSCINQFCKIVSEINNIRMTRLQIGQDSIIGVSHNIDMTHNVIIGDNSILAGVRSQIWTHGFYHPSTISDHWRIDGEVIIGNNVNIGSGCILCSGVIIQDNISIGAGSVVSKNLTEPGLYVSQSLRHIEFIPEERIRNFCEVASNVFVKKKV